jgi:hypothetical protein
MARARNVPPGSKPANAVRTRANRASTEEPIAVSLSLNLTGAYKRAKRSSPKIDRDLVETASLIRWTLQQSLDNHAQRHAARSSGLRIRRPAGRPTRPSMVGLVADAVYAEPRKQARRPRFPARLSSLVPKKTAEGRLAPHLDTIVMSRRLSMSKIVIKNRKALFCRTYAVYDVWQTSNTL